MHFLESFIEKCHIALLQKNSKIPLSYLISRGISLDEIKTQKIGYIGKFMNNPIDTEEEEIKNFNKWMGKRGYFISERIIFPIFDELGHIKGIETRALDKEAMKVLKPEYKEKFKDLIDNLSDTSVRYSKFYLDKSRYSACFFGLPNSLKTIWDTRTLFLTEGIFDCLTLLKLYPNCLASLTANVNKYQIDWLRRYVNKIIFLFDGDKKGKEAVEKLKERLGSDFQICSINLVKKDVNETALAIGLKDLKNIIDDKLTRFL